MASVSINIVMPGILSVVQDALMLPSEQKTLWILGMSSASSGFHLKAKEKGVCKDESYTLLLVLT